MRPARRVRERSTRRVLLLTSGRRGEARGVAKACALESREHERGLARCRPAARGVEVEDPLPRGVRVVSAAEGVEVAAEDRGRRRRLGVYATPSIGGPKPERVEDFGHLLGSQRFGLVVEVRRGDAEAQCVSAAEVERREGRGAALGEVARALIAERGVLGSRAQRERGRLDDSVPRAHGVAEGHGAEEAEFSLRLAEHVVRELEPRGEPREVRRALLDGRRRAAAALFSAHGAVIRGAFRGGLEGGVAGKRVERFVEAEHVDRLERLERRRQPFEVVFVLGVAPRVHVVRHDAKFLDVGA
mmetsp:Transcript_12214/g.49175  ORF Transcript_12214/g.49175 Transcript_12214/m.49175 type:complete len:301 (+) Transcript_12214:1303-2205(+)